MEKRKVALQEAKLKAKGLNPDGTPALSTLGGFSPASKPSMSLQSVPCDVLQVCCSTDIVFLSVLQVLLM